VIEPVAPKHNINKQSLQNRRILRTRFVLTTACLLRCKGSSWRCCCDDGSSKQLITLEGGQVERPGRHSRLQFGRCIRGFRLGWCPVVAERIQVGHRGLWAWGGQFGSTTAPPGMSGCTMPAAPAPAARRSLSTRTHTNSSPFQPQINSSYTHSTLIDIHPQLRQGIRSFSRSFGNHEF
jgi:hypothetical protein